MSEVVGSLDPVMPVGYEKLDGIEVVKQQDGSIRYNGLLRLGTDGVTLDRKVLLPDLAEVWGYDSEQSQTEWESRQADPEKWVLYSRVAELEQRVAELTDRLSGRGAPIDSSVIVTPAVPARETGHKAEKTIGPGILLSHRHHDGSITHGLTAISRPWPEDNGVVYVTVRDDNGQNHIIPEHDLLPDAGQMEPQPDWPIPRRVESDSPVKRAWHRTAGRLGGLMLGAQVRLHNGASRALDRPSPAVAVEEFDGYTTQEIASGEQALGVAAVAAVLGGLVAYLIWGRHGATPPEIINHIREHKVYLGGNHTDYLRPGGQSAVDLPQKLRLAKDFSGHEIIKNSLGHTVVSHAELPEGFQDRQGNLSIAARAILRAKGYILTQGHVPGVSWRRMTEIWAHRG